MTDQTTSSFGLVTQAPAPTDTAPKGKKRRLRWVPVFLAATWPANMILSMPVIDRSHWSVNRLFNYPMLGLAAVLTGIWLVVSDRRAFKRTGVMPHGLYAKLRAIFTSPTDNQSTPKRKRLGRHGENQEIAALRAELEAIKASAQPPAASAPIIFTPPTATLTPAPAAVPAPHASPAATPISAPPHQPLSIFAPRVVPAMPVTDPDLDLDDLDDDPSADHTDSISGFNPVDATMHTTAFIYGVINGELLPLDERGVPLLATMEPDVFILRHSDGTVQQVRITDDPAALSAAEQPRSSHTGGSPDVLDLGSFEGALSFGIDEADRPA